MDWRDRIEAAMQPRFGIFVRGFSLQDVNDASNWGTCAVGEQGIGYVDPYMKTLGVKFYHAVMMSPLLSRFSIRQASYLLNEIEKYAEELRNESRQV